METLNYLVIVIYFLGLIAVSWIMSRRIKSSEDMFIAGRSSSWWLSGMSTYMTIFSASTFVIWGGVAYRSGLVAALIGNLVGIACIFAGKWFAGRWRKMRINSPGDFLVIRFGQSSVDFYTLMGVIGRGFHTAVALYAIAIVMSTLMVLPEGSLLATAPDAHGVCHLSVYWAILILGVITLIYTVIGGFLAVLMTDVIQFGVLMSVVLFMIPLSLHYVGGFSSFINSSLLPDGYFVPTSAEYPWSWLVLWLFLNLFQMGGDWPFVQRYLSIPTAKGARKSNYLVGVLYLITPIIWYLPAMIYRSIDANANPEQAYILMSQTVLMNGMLGVMLAAMVSATLSTVSGTLNVYANVFTYQIWGKNKKNASEKQLIGVGRKFTLIYGITIVALALLVPLMGGAEKVVVTILTMVIAPLYIPSVWGVFSRYITGKQVIWSMVITYVLGFALKFSPYKLNIHPQLLEATIGLLIPVGLMLVCEIYGRWKGLDDKGYDRIQELTDPDADVEPDATARKAVRSYSYMAISCFCITLTAIGLLLCWLLYTGQYADAAVRQIMLWACAAIALIDLSYITYRYIHRDK